MKLSANPKYAKMFVALSTRTVPELQDAFTLMYIQPSSGEKSLSLACIGEELENRIGEEEAGKFIDSFYEVAA